MLRVGERLQKERTRKGLTLEEVAKATKIRLQFLQAIEKGDYKSLPSSAYIQGFIRNYAEFLELPVRETVAIFKREFDEREYLGVLPKSFTKPEHSALAGFRFGWTPLFIILGLVFILFYVIFQYRSAFINPSLTITAPQENAVVASQIITVTGKTDPNDTVTINDLPAFTDKDGNFKKDITVFAGANSITVKTVNNFGKISIVVRHIILKNQ